MPEGEAQHAAAFSVASLGNAKALAPHSAHLVLIYTPAEDLSAVGELQAFTRVLAALLVASGAQAVYWGAAGASHPAGFFVEVAQNVEIPLPLWSGVSRWRLPDGRLGLLSLGMAQLGLLDLFVTAPADEATGALGFFYDLLTYVAERGSVLRDGETTGRSEDEQLVVHHRPSPDDDTLMVFAVDLPTDGPASDRRPELREQRVVLLRPLLERLVALVLDDLQRRSRDLPGQLAAEALGQAEVELAHGDERRHRDRAHAVVGVVLEQGVGRAAEGVDGLRRAGFPPPRSATPP